MDDLTNFCRLVLNEADLCYHFRKGEDGTMPNLERT